MMSFAYPAARLAGRPNAPLRTQAANPAGWADYFPTVVIISVYAAALTSTARWASNSGVLLPEDADPRTTAAQVPVTVIAGIWAACNAARMPDMIRSVLPHLIIIALCFLSISWSDYQYISVRRSVTLTVCVLFGLYINDRLGADGIRLFARTAVTLAILSPYPDEFTLFVAMSLLVLSRAKADAVAHRRHPPATHVIAPRTIHAIGMPR